MSDELRRALDDLAARTAAGLDARTRAGDGLPVPAMTARAGRRRTARAALVSTAALVTVTAVAVAGVAVTRDDRTAPPPPAGSPSPAVTSAPTPSPSPTSSPTPTGPPPVVLPAFDPSLPLGACGSGASALPVAPVLGGLGVQVTVPTPVVGVGDALAVTARPTADVDRGRSGVVDLAGPRFLVLHDGVVVGASDVSGGDLAGSTRLDWGDGLDPTYTGLLDLTVCTPGEDALAGALPAGSATALPEGDYELLPVLRYQESTSEQGDAVAADLDARGAAPNSVLLGAPVPVTVRGGPATSAGPGPADPGALVQRLQQLRTDHGGPVPAPFCGDPLPAADDLAGAVTLAVDPVGSAGTGVPVDVAASLRWDGPGTARLSMLPGVTLAVTSGGVVVGWATQEVDLPNQSFTVGAGGVVDVSASRTLRLCDDGSAGLDFPALPAGDYQVVAVVPVAVAVPGVVPDLADPWDAYTAVVVSAPWDLAVR